MNISDLHRRVSVTPIFKGLLDDFPNASGAFSLRKLRNDYNGFAIRVRRSSDDAVQDIGFLSDGNLDESSLLSFVGSGSGFVEIWYNQSGNNLHFSQTTLNFQPRIVLNGVIDKINGKPCLFNSVNGGGFSGNNSVFSVSTNENFSLFSLYRWTSFIDNELCILAGINNAASTLKLTRFGEGLVAARFVTPNVDFGFNTPVNTNNIIDFGRKDNIFYNSKNSIPGTPSLNFNNGVTINRVFTTGNTGNSFIGFCPEIIHYPFSQSLTNRQSVISNINNYYGIF